MITKSEIDNILRRYQKGKVTIGTLGSHSALNIFKGAKEEGFRTICICRKDDEVVYQRFPLADDFILVESFRELLHDDIQQRLRQKKHNLDSTRSLQRLHWRRKNNERIAYTTFRQQRTPPLGD